MAGWNKPNAANQPVVKQGGAKSPSLMKGIIVGAVAVLVGVVCIFAFSGKSEKPVKDTGTKLARIKEVTPAATPKAAEEKKVPEKPRELPPQQIGETRNGKILLPNGELHTVKGVITCKVDKVSYQIFSHRCENIIAQLLTLEPGEWILGTPEYNGEVTKDFLASLKEPIIPTHDDSDYNRDLKKLVNQAKIELKAAYDRGEDIEKILIDSHEELQKLARYKSELMSMTIEGIDSSSTPDEVETYIEAANKMLEAKGIAPMDLSPLAKIKLRMMSGGGNTNEGEESDEE